MCTVVQSAPIISYLILLYLVCFAGTARKAPIVPRHDTAISQSSSQPAPDMACRPGTLQERPATVYDVAQNEAPAMLKSTERPGTIFLQPGEQLRASGSIQPSGATGNTYSAPGNGRSHAALGNGKVSHSIPHSMN